MSDVSLSKLKNNLSTIKEILITKDNNDIFVCLTGKIDDYEPYSQCKSIYLNTEKYRECIGYFDIRLSIGDIDILYDLDVNVITRLKREEEDIAKDIYYTIEDVLFPR